MGHVDSEKVNHLRLAREINTEARGRWTAKPLPDIVKTPSDTTWLPQCDMRNAIATSTYKLRLIDWTLD